MCITLKGKEIYWEINWDSTVTKFHTSQDQNQNCIAPRDDFIRMTLPFKDQKSTDIVHRDLRDLGKKIDCVLQPAFTIRKIAEDLKVTETEPSLVNQQCVNCLGI